MILIMTASVQPKGTPFLAVDNGKIRIEQYISAVKFYLEQKNIDKIVFCDNTLYEYDYTALQEYAKSKGKELEVLCFQGDNEGVKNKGKGYGEGETIKYILSHSKLMKDQEVFAKVTGRYIIDNVNKILTEIQKGKNYFNYSGLKLPMVNTLFYVVNKKDFETYLLDCYEQVSDKQKKSLERVVYRILKQGEICFCCLPFYPRLTGISGTSGASLRENIIKFHIKNFLCRLGIFNRVFEKSIVRP